MYDDADVLLDKSFHFAYEGTDLETEGPLEPIVQVNTTINMAIEQGFVLMQFTGLKDNNGKEIYEGDILSWLSEEEGLGEIYEVYFDSKIAAFRTKCKGVDEDSFFNTGMVEDVITDEIEVIGNIYENPYLLKGENL